MTEIRADSPTIWPEPRAGKTVQYQGKLPKRKVRERSNRENEARIGGEREEGEKSKEGGEMIGQRVCSAVGGGGCGVPRGSSGGDCMEKVLV